MSTEEWSGSPTGRRRRDTLILAVVGLATAVLLFASAALPVLSDRGRDDASGATPVPSTTAGSRPPPSTGTPLLSPATSPPPTTTLPPVSPTTRSPPPPTTTAVPMTVPASPPASPTTTAPPEADREPKAVVVPRRADRTGARVGSLAVGPIDLSALPRVAFDVVVPKQLAAVQLRPRMVAVDGARAASVTAVEPSDIAAALVIDDGPTVDAHVLGHLQGASVELARNLGHGTELALATPSGLATAFTASRDANIGRIAAITAGSPAVAPLPDLLTTSIRELAANPAPDRHAVLLLGDGLDPTAEQLAALEDAVTTTGSRLHLIVPPGVDAAEIASIARSSGGVIASSRNVVASIDAVTAAIARRYQVVASMTSRGEHAIALTAKGLRFEATVQLA